METSSEQVCEDLLALLKRLKLVLATMAEVHDLTAPQLHALSAIFKGESTMGRLAESLHCDASNITGIIDRLVAQKLVTRTESPTDRRAKVLQLTDKGEAVLAQVLTKLPTELGCQKFNPVEREQLHMLIRKLV